MIELVANKFINNLVWAFWYTIRTVGLEAAIGTRDLSVNGHSGIVVNESFRADRRNSAAKKWDKGIPWQYTVVKDINLQESSIGFRILRVISLPSLNHAKTVSLTVEAMG